ncbi:hypothetical protein TWF506_003748 [Arthrobotrys conoides]|uniref:F-box domain-containing protein n=1 Tax=Arthrobotrys conoides TaxID=74498 RepID=A0AAN8RJ02_9PEZI
MNSNRLSTIRGPAIEPKTDISSLPLELHAEILNCLGHWSHCLVASQVCRAWHDLLKKYRDPSVYYQNVDVYPGSSTEWRPFGRPATHTPRVHGRHLLFQECTVVYRRCPLTQARKIKISPTKDLGFYDYHALCYFPNSPKRPEFYNFDYFSLLSSPIATTALSTILGDHESSDEPKPSYFLEFDRMCLKMRIPLLNPTTNQYLSLGNALDDIYNIYKQCFEFTCTDCANKFEARNTRNRYQNTPETLDDVGLASWDFGDWEKTGYEECGKQCREFGIIIQEREKRRRPNVIVLRVSPGDSWIG